MVDQRACNHHWHDTGVVKTSKPPCYEQICCRCGEKRDYRPVPVPYNHYLSPPCGPYEPKDDGYTRFPLTIRDWMRLTKEDR